MVVYFVQDDRLVPVERIAMLLLPTREEWRFRAVEVLLQGPPEAQQRAGLISLLLAGIGLNSVRMQRPFTWLDLDDGLDRLKRSGAWLALNQLVYTVTEFPGIAPVTLLVNGENVGNPVRPLGADLMMFNIPTTRDLDAGYLTALTPVGVLDLFIGVIPDTARMWEPMSESMRAQYGSPHGIDGTAFAEGLGSWVGYVVEALNYAGNAASITIAKEVELEGMMEYAQ
ncbi:MAG: GerMN domain-containing protein [Bacillota bacterium]